MSKLLTFRRLTEEEIAANAAAAPFDDGELLHPPPTRYRWHCLTCGRFVPFTGVRKLPAYRWEDDEHEYRGVCKTHGDVDVTWGQQ